MTPTIVETLADFAAAANYETLPPEVIEETKRLLLDSIGCSLGGIESSKGAIGVQFGRMLGGDATDATIHGTAHRSSVFGAAWANGETMNALDFDAILPPGHVSPYVIPGAVAVAERDRLSGRDLIAATAVAHEISYRFGKSMDWTRDAVDGVAMTSSVLGYTSTVFGGAAAIARLRGLDRNQIASALGIAGSTSPVNSHRSWLSHVPSATIKYTMAGPVVLTALSAAFNAELGHRGDLQVLDDAEYGYRRFINTKRWVPENLTDGLGVDWRYPRESSYKPYPHCRVMHSVFDTLIDLMEANDLQADDIDALRAWGEGWVVDLPVWLNESIDDVLAGQFSVKHGLAVAAQRVRPGPAWQKPELVFSPSVLNLMDRVTFAGHPDFFTALARDSASRPARIEIDARGTTFSSERLYPKGSPTADPATYATTDELIEKFVVNAVEVMPAEHARDAAKLLVDLENVDDVTDVGRALAAREAVASAPR